MGMHRTHSTMQFSVLLMELGSCEGFLVRLIRSNMYINMETLTMHSASGRSVISMPMFTIMTLYGLVVLSSLIGATIHESIKPWINYNPLLIEY